MAPGRKKGVGRAKARNQLSLGDLVLAKVKGFPPWPAKISRPEDWDRLPDPKKYFVQFFGTDEIAFVAPPDIQAFTDESRSKLSARCQGKPVKYFARAVKEICEAFEELQEKSTGYSRNGDIDGSALCNADFAGDNYESELKDQTNTLGHLEVANTEFPENRVHGLERCSRSRSERVHMDTDHGIACDMGDESSPVLSVSKGITALNKTTHLPKKDAVSSLSPVKEEISPSNGPGHDLGIEVGDANSGEMCPSLDITETRSKGLAGSDRDGLGDVKQNSPIDLVEENRGSPPLPGSLHSKHSGGRDKVSMNGHGCYILPPKSSKLGHSEVCVRLSESGEGSKDETIQKIARGKNVLCDSLRELSPYASKSDIHSGQKPKILLKSSKRASRKHLEKDENSLGARYCSKARSDKNSEERGIDKPFSSIDHKNKITQPRSRKPKVISDDHSVPAKKRTREEIYCDMSEKSTLIIESKDSLHSVVIRKAGEKVIVSKRTASHVESGDEDLLPLTKRRRLAVEAMPDVPEKSPNFPKKDFPSGSDCGKSLKVEVDEECTTPIHRLSATITRHPAPTVSDCDQIAHIHEESPSRSRLDKKDVKVEILNPSCSQAPGPKIADKKNVVELHVSSPGKVEMQKISNKEKTTILSPGSSLGLDKAAAKHSEHRNVKPHSKPSGPAAVRKAPGGISKGSGLVSESLNHAKAQVTPQRNKPKFSSEKLMVTPKTNSKMNMPVESRLEAVKEDKASCSSMEPKVADSSLSMKHLIAAAQAKRRQAHCQSLAREDTEAYIPAFISTPPLLQGKSPSPVPGVPAFSSGNPMLHQDVREFLGPKPSASPCANSHLLGLQNQTDPEEYEEGRFSLRGSLSGGTEAAVARDAFEGMVETLSRTKESIGRATRLAIDCAKYGIAGEVVELLIRKLENEASFHRRVDLFFLVDSITQCSHSQKGIAGASYIPTVQAALPRLLGAAAPHGAGARENRRQCLKVLRLWHERKILPEVLLRRYMDEIGVPNDDASTGFFLRRPSRAERAVDDPIREMEGMLVDEYGSNATFQLPGFLSSHVFEDEEDLPTSLCMETGDGSSIETANALEEPQRRTDTPSDRRGRILEDVDGELEMEDVSASSKDEPTIPKNDSLRLGSQKRAPCGILASPASDENELPPLPMGSPPLPAESPPPPPPLPPSPPPPPPPFSPSPPPPPPPPLPPPSLPSSFSSSFTNQPPIPQDYCRTSTKNQLFQMKGNASLQSHANAVPLGAEMILEKPSCFAAPGICNTQDVSGLSSSRPFEFGQNGMFLHPQPSHLNLQFQTCSTSFSQRSIQPLPPPQAPSSHFSYVSSTVQQPVHHPYHNYQFPSLPNGRRQYVNDERWRSHSSDPALDNQQGVLLAGGRSTLCSHPPFVQEGFFQSLAERPCGSSLSFQLPVQKSLASGVPMPGHGVVQMFPCRSDVSSLNCWRPT